MRINILICTPMYAGMCHLDYVNSLLDFHRLKIPFSLMGIGNESLIPRGRDTCVSYFNELKDFTHLLFLDADIGFMGDSLIKLISHNKDVSGCPVALKGFTKEGKPVYNIGNFVRQEGNLVVTDRLGTAVMLLSRKAIDSLIKISEPYQNNKYTRGGKDIQMYNVFKVGVKDGQYLSEDFWCAKTLVELGYEIFVDPTLPTIHNASWQFS